MITTCPLGKLGKKSVSSPEMHRKMYRGTCYSECPLSEAILYLHLHVHVNICHAWCSTNLYTTDAGVEKVPRAKVSPGTSAGERLLSVDVL